MMETTDETLRQQFQVLQDQQQKKLLRRKQRQEEKDKRDEATSKGSEGKGGAKKKKKELGGLALDDDLDLKLSEPISNDVLYNEELNNGLKDQIRELKDETGRLYKLLSERDYEIRKLKKQRDDDRQAIGGSGIASDTAATKIVELSKKNRELTAELESERTKVKQLMRKVRDTEKELASTLYQNKNGEGSTTNTSQRSSLNQSQDQATTTAAELKSLHESFAKSQAKQTEYRNQVNILKQELKVAQKVLTSELGENVSIQSLKNETGSGWRGRAQQIMLLQNKVSELTRQLDQYKNPPGTDMTLEEQFMTMDVTDDRASLTAGVLKSSKGGGGSMDERQRLRLRQQEKGKREEQEKAATELRLLEEDHGKLKEKFEASKSRNKVLSNEVKSVKQQLATLLDKGKHDNELIEALLSQQTQLKKHLELGSKQQEDAKRLGEQAAQQLQQRSQQDANTVEQMRMVLGEKEAKVRELEEALREMHEQQRIHLNGYPDTHPDRPQSRPLTISSMDRPATTDRYSGMSPAASAVPPQSRQGSRPPSGPRSSSKLSNGEGSGRSSSRGVRPASTGSVTSASGEGMEEYRRQLQQYKSLCQVAEVERDKLMELVQILQNRADGANMKTTEAQSSLQETKQRNVWLEKQLGKVKVENNNNKGVKRSSSLVTQAVKTSLFGGYVTDGDLVKGDLAVNQEVLEELQTRLAIKIDENDALKSAVKGTLKAKEEDLKLYHDMMKQTKEVFLQGLRQFRQGNNSLNS